MMEARSLCKRFGAVAAVDELSFIAADGRITGLLGHNGAGKTTALRLLSGLCHPDRGTALVDGIDAARDPVAARRRLGILPDARGLYPRLSARENIRYFGRLYGLAGRALERRIDELLDLLGLAALADRRAGGFSQGERMKVAIARALVHDPPNIVLDEPTVGLDVMSVRSLRQLIRDRRERGRAVLFSSHAMHEVATLCDEVIVLAAGKAAAIGTLEELRAKTGKDSLEEAFVALCLPESAAELDAGESEADEVRA